MIAFCPANAEIVVVMSAFPRLISGKLGRLGVEAVMVTVEQERRQESVKLSSEPRHPQRQLICITYSYVGKGNR
jgi:hypothetical protein